MEWIEARITTTSEGVEPVFSALMSCGITGAQIVDHDDMMHFLENNPLQWDYVDEELTQAAGTEAAVVFYVTPDPLGMEMLEQVKMQLHTLSREEDYLSLGTLALTHTLVDDESWLHEWKKYFKPLKISPSVVVRPVWEPYKNLPGEIVFSIDPGSVFGTGLHQTTQLCVTALEKEVTPGCRILDVGCGSGILSLIALLLGAESAFACDIDPAAISATRDNARLNHIDLSRITISAGDIFTDLALQDRLKGCHFDIMVANIVADVVIALLPLAVGYLSEGGRFIASGIITERFEAVASVMRENGFRIIDHLEKDGWHSLVCDRGQPDA